MRASRAQEGWRRLGAIPGRRDIELWRAADGELRVVDGGNSGEVLGPFLVISGASPMEPWCIAVCGGEVIFGELPSGAAAVTLPGIPGVRPLVADGAFAAWAEHRPASEVYARFTDGDGRVVRWAARADTPLSRAPLPVEDIACPVCGEDAWERLEYRAPPESASTREALTACATCGYSPGGWIEAGRRRAGRHHDEPAPFDDLPDLSPEEAVAAAAFDVYALAAQPARVTSWSHDEAGRVVGVTLRHGDITVTTSAERDAPVTLEGRARGGLAAALGRGDDRWRQEPWDTVELRIHTRHRDAHALARSAAVSLVGMSLGGRQREGTLATTGDAWCCAVALDGIIVSVVGRGESPTEFLLEPFTPAV